MATKRLQSLQKCTGILLFPEQKHANCNTYYYRIKQNTYPDNLNLKFRD